MKSSNAAESSALCVAFQIAWLHDDTKPSILFGYDLKNRKAFIIGQPGKYIHFLCYVQI